MNIKKHLLKLIAFTLIFTFLINYTLLVMATTKKELQNQQSDINEKITETKTEIKNVTKEMSSTMKEVEKLTTTISGYESEIQNLDTEINNLETDIEKTTTNLEEKLKTYDEKKALVGERIIALYEAGETTFLDVLLTSKSITDFISNYYLLTEVTNYDAEMLEEIERQKQEIENAQSSLVVNKATVAIKKEEKEETAQALKGSKDLKEKYVNELSAEEKELQAKLDEFEKDRKEIERELNRILQEELKKSKGYNMNLVPSASGYITPVPGYKITTGYGRYSWGGTHIGVDYSGSGINGKPVLAVKSGTVLTSTALKSSSGKYRSYGEYIIINHHDGTLTLYAHGQTGSRTVKQGDKVSQGQVIMKVGSTGNSTGPHLHFEVRIIQSNGTTKVVNPTPYLP